MTRKMLGAFFDQNLQRIRSADFENESSAVEENVKRALSLHRVNEWRLSTTFLNVIATQLNSAAAKIINQPRD